MHETMREVRLPPSRLAQNHRVCNEEIESRASSPIDTELKRLPEVFHACRHDIANNGVALHSNVSLQLSSVSKWFDFFIFR